MQISVLEEAERKKDLKLANIQGSMRSKAEDMETLRRSLTQLEVTVQGLVVFSKWQADVVQRMTLGEKENGKRLNGVCLILRKKLQDEAETNQKLLLLRQEVENQLRRVTASEANKQLQDEAHALTRLRLEEKESQLLSTVEGLKIAEERIARQDSETTRIASELKETQERLKSVSQSVEEEVDRHENHAESCKRVTSGIGTVSSSAPDASASTSLDEKKELESSRLGFRGLENTRG